MWALGGLGIREAVEVSGWGYPYVVIVSVVQAVWGLFIQLEMMEEIYLSTV